MFSCEQYNTHGIQIGWQLQESKPAGIKQHDWSTVSKVTIEKIQYD